jgi:hypothetical protein
MTKADTSVRLNRAQRPDRIPITGFRDKLTVEGKEPGFHYAWIRDDFVARAERASYEYVTHEVIVGDTRIAASAIGGKVSIPGGNGVTLFLMRVPQEYYDSDMDEMQAEVDAREADMKRTLNSGQDGQYGKVEVDVKSRR